MRRRPGAVVTAGACLALLVALLWAYLPESTGDVNVYYASGAFNPLFGGLLAIGVLAALAAVRRGYLRPSIGSIIVFGLGLATSFVVVGWALTGRVDVFRAPGWAYPAQRWVLAGVSLVLALGAARYASDGLRAREQ